MDNDDFVRTFVTLIQEFELLANDRTPCGEKTSISEAHGLNLLMREQPLAQKELASRLRPEKSTVSRLVDQLDTKGWIETIDVGNSSD